MSAAITRFAPSPTGYLHLGHAASAFAVWEKADELGAKVILRIEDIDITRCKPEYEAAIYEDLKWLGLTWEPDIRRQSDHFDDYAATLKQLQVRGLVYRCFKTRKEVMEDMARAPHGRGEVYVGVPLHPDEEQALLDQDRPYAWRLSIMAARDALGADFDRLTFANNGQTMRAEPEILGDVVLGRKDVGTSYHIACCHDDALQGVTHITRGEDLLESTHLHRLLQALMGWLVPDYEHHGLLKNDAGERLAKRNQSTTLRSLRDQGYTPDDIRAMASLAK